MMVLLIDFDLALRPLELLARQAFADEGIGVRPDLLDGLGKEVRLNIGALHDGIGDLVFSVLRPELLDEALIVGGGHRLEVAHRGVMAGSIIAAHCDVFLLGPLAASLLMLVENSA